jgi:CBS domain-containing protein
MTIEAFIQTDVVVVDASCSAREAARAMRDRHVGAVVVVSDASGAGPLKLEGMVTDRDLALAVVAEDADAGTRIGAFARRPLVSVPREASVAQAAAIMRSAAVRRLVVVDGERAMVGIVALDDLLAGAADLLSDLSDATNKARDREIHQLREPVDGDGSLHPITVPPQLGAAWRNIVQP